MVMQMVSLIYFFYLPSYSYFFMYWFIYQKVVAAGFSSSEWSVTIHVWNTIILSGRTSTQDAMGHQIGCSWWTHWAISHSSHCSTTDITIANLFLCWGVVKHSFIWYNKGCDIYYPACGMVHIKESLFLIGK